MYKNILLPMMLILALCQTVQAQPLSQFTGTWTTARKGTDVETSTANQMGTTIKWVIKGTDDDPQVTVYYVYSAGFVSDSSTLVSETAYADGKLTVTTHPEISNSFINVNTYYEITFGSGGQATGTYVEVVRSPANTHWDFMTNMMVPSPDVKQYGTLAMTKVSKSVSPPKVKAKTTPDTSSAPTFPMPTWSPTPSRRPLRPTKNVDQCRIDEIMCSQSCDSAPNFGSSDGRRFSQCQARCAARRDNCLR